MRTARTAIEFGANSEMRFLLAAMMSAVIVPARLVRMTLRAACRWSRRGLR
jgi:hypothetical protein